jgi:hypothetical protein
METQSEEVKGSSQSEEIRVRIAASKERMAKKFERLEIPKGVKVSYFQNPYSEEMQYLCVVRSYDPLTRTATFGFSINNPPRWVLTKKTKTLETMEYRDGDPFSRRVGRNEALRNMKHKTQVLHDEFPLAACLRHIVTLSQIENEKNNVKRSSVNDAASYAYRFFPRRDEPTRKEKFEEELEAFQNTVKESLEASSARELSNLERNMKVATRTGVVLLIGVMLGQILVNLLGP